MNKLSNKLTLIVAGILIVVLGLSFLLNNFFLYKYYLHKMKITVGEVSEVIDAYKEQDLAELSPDDLSELITNLEDTYSVTITHIPLDEDIDTINEQMFSSLRKKQVTLNKFWISEEVVESVRQGEKINRLFNQGKVKSSFLVRFAKKGNELVLIGVFVTHDNDTIALVNEFYLYLMVMAVLMAVVLFWYFSKRIIAPLIQLRSISEDIANLNYTTVSIRTGDEIEALAQSINIMSNKLSQAQTDQEQKNESLKSLITNIAHELKTPIALIKAYSIGLKDNMDDGTYTDTIINQANSIADLIDRLLTLARFEKESLKQNAFNLKQMLEEVMAQHSILIEQRQLNLTVDCDRLSSSIIVADRDKIEMVLNNLVSNSIKYTTDGSIHITMKDKGECLHFAIRNGIDIEDRSSINRVWEPFYVMDGSRDRKESSTGLGLSIVDAILKNHGLVYNLSTYKDQIEIYIDFVKLA